MHSTQKQRLFMFMNLILFLMSSVPMQVLQSKMDLLQFCSLGSASNECTTSSRQPDFVQQAQYGPGRPSSTAHSGSQMTLKEAPVRHCVEGSPLSTVHALQSRHQQDGWRLRPEHRFPISFWQQAHDFLVSVAVDRSQSGTKK